MGYDIAIIGGGPGGYVAAIYAAKQNYKVALIEKDELGGTCLNYGCIPTKSLIHSAEIYGEFLDAELLGIKAKEIEIDWKITQKNKSDIVSTLTGGVSTLLKKNKIDVFKGKAEFIDKNTIKIITEEEKEISATDIIIATGSTPIKIPIEGNDLEGVITSKEALELEEIPKSMAVIGGGVIGVEMAYIYNTVGTEVSIIEMTPNLIPNNDELIISAFTDDFKNQGINVFVDSKVQSIEKAGEELKVIYETKEGIKEVTVEKVLMSVGRKPEMKILEGLDLATDKSGIVVDEYLRTSIPNIYAIGDVTGKMMLAHVASHQGITAVKNILGEKEKMSYKVIPACIYTNPEVASVGLTEEEARAKYGDEIVVSISSFQMNGKALTMGKASGYVKIICDKKWNEILGVHIIGPNATELIAEAALSIKLECTAEELCNTIHAHPTLAEAIMETAQGILGVAIHSL